MIGAQIFVEIYNHFAKHFNFFGGISIAQYVLQ